MKVIKRFTDNHRPMLRTFLSEIEVDGVPKTLHTIVASSLGTVSPGTTTIWGHILDEVSHPDFQMEMAVDFDSTFPHLSFGYAAADIFVTIEPFRGSIDGYKLQYMNKDKETVTLACMEVTELGFYLQPVPWLKHYQYYVNRPGVTASDLVYGINNLLTTDNDSIDLVYGWVNAYEKWYAEEREPV